MADSPEFIGKYKVQGVIAKGGMGVVYKAIHPSLKRYVVIKKMTARRSSTNIERFKREAQILLDLQSPYIVHLFDYFTEGGYRYMVEEFVDGMAVDKLLQKQVVLSPQMSLLILQDACYALKYAHSKEIVHRDIKPGNILISKRAEIKLADFGIASDKEQTNDDSITQAGVALGTPAYMPPEQFENSAAVDQRVDIYALGIMLYEMVTGTKPYPGSLTLETLNIIKKGKYISPKKIEKSCPRVVCRLIRKMLQPKAKYRFKSTEPILKIIKRYLKHYDVHSIRVQLAKLLASNETVKEMTYIPKDLKFRKVRAAIVSVALVASVACFCFKQGYVHKFLLRHWYTPVKVEILMPNTSSVSLDLPVQSYFFENDRDKIPEVPNSMRVLSTPRKEKKGESKKYKYFYAKDVYLRPGDYRVKLVVGPYVWWKSFTVGKEDYTLDCNFLKDMRRPVRVNPTAYDAKTGKNITSNITVKVSSEGFWKDLSEVPSEKILNNNIGKFKFSAEGYKDEIFSLRFDWYQDELFVSANLEPVN